MNIWLKIAELRKKFPVSSKVKILRTALSSEFLKKLGEGEVIGTVTCYDYLGEWLFAECDIDFECNLSPCTWELYEDQIELCQP